MGSYKDIVRESFKKHSGKPSKEIMRLAAKEWAEHKKGGNLPNDVSDIDVSGGKLKKKYARRHEMVNNEPEQFNTDMGQEMPRYNTDRSKQFQGRLPKVIPATNVSNSHVMEQMFGGSANNWSYVYGGSFWDDVGDFFSNPGNLLGVATMLL